MVLFLADVLVPTNQQLVDISLKIVVLAVGHSISTESVLVEIPLVHQDVHCASYLECIHFRYFPEPPINLDDMKAHWQVNTALRKRIFTRYSSLN